MKNPHTSLWNSFLAGLWKHQQGLILGLAAVGGLCLVRFSLGLPCPFQYLFGISCAGCGMTRALWSLIRLDFPAALAYHPLCVALPPIAILLFICSVKGWKRASRAVLLLFAAAMIAVYLWRLLLTDSSVVIFDPKSGAIYRLLQRIWARFAA